MSKTESVDSWAGVVAELIRSFLILRDIFGYALPGAMFLGIGVLRGRIRLQSLQDLSQPYHPPIWVAVVLLVGACYVVGQVLATVAYLPFDIWKWWVSRRKPTDPWLVDHPTEVNAEILGIRRQYPEFFVELDRRETITILTASMMVAFLGGVIVFCWGKLGLCTTLVIGGLLLLVDFSTAIPHLRRVRKAVRDAAKAVPCDSGPSGSDLGKEVLAVLKNISEFLKKH
jgi:hypothetical protein